METGIRSEDWAGSDLCHQEADPAAPLPPLDDGGVQGVAITNTCLRCQTPPPPFLFWHDHRP
eukprot:COSAG01_NODE_47589_length_388_cov_653.816609_1_plen_61_part_10